MSFGYDGFGELGYGGSPNVIDSIISIEADLTWTTDSGGIAFVDLIASLPANLNWKAEPAGTLIYNDLLSVIADLSWGANSGNLDEFESIISLVADLNWTSLYISTLVLNVDLLLLPSDQNWSAAGGVLVSLTQDECVDLFEEDCSGTIVLVPETSACLDELICE